MVMLSTISCQEGSTEDAGVVDAVIADASVDAAVDAPIDAEIDADVDAEVDAEQADASTLVECHDNRDCPDMYCCGDSHYCVPGIPIFGLCVPYSDPWY